MNPPTSLSRFLAGRRVSAALTVTCVLCALGWFGGAVPWWLGLISLSFLGTLHKAQKQVRRYDAWRREWDEMGSAPRPAAPARKARKAARPSSAKGTVIAALSLVIIPMIMRTPEADDGLRIILTLLWLGLALFLLWKLVLRFRRVPFRSIAAIPKAAGKIGEADVVEWVLPRASSCLSRAEASRRVPDYCARLLTAK